MFVKLKGFIRTAVLGGVIVVLPVALVFIVFRWLFVWVTGLVQPLTNVIATRSPIQGMLAELLGIFLILLACFLIGLAVRTRFGSWFHHTVERSLLRVAPGYNLAKEIVIQFFGSKKPPFSTVALAQLYGNEVLVTAFITDEHSDGSYTIFVPTGPNPTSGFIYHLPAKYVHPVSASVEATMRSVISCGVGSGHLLDLHRKGKRVNEP